MSEHEYNHYRQTVLAKTNGRNIHNIYSLLGFLKIHLDNEELNKSLRVRINQIIKI